MRLGFEVSDLFPEKAGVYTYASQLLRHLAQLDTPPTLTFLDGPGQHSFQELVTANDGLLPSGRFARARIGVPLLHLKDGPWKKDYRTRRLAYLADVHMLEPVWQRANGMPRVARWNLPPRTRGTLDVCHWSHRVFMPIRGLAHVATVHDTIAWVHPEWQPLDSVAHHIRELRLVARRATRIIADSEHTRHDIVRLLDVDPEHIDVVPLAAGPEYRAPTTRVEHDVLVRHGLQVGNYVIYVGTIEPRKNLVRLATAFRALINRRPELTTRLVLAGRRGWLSEPIYDGLDALGLGDRLVMPGRVAQEDLPALLHGAGVVAYVSLYEGFGLPPLEAMACGSAVMASNSTSIPEVVGDAALLVDPLNVAEITHALERILTDNGLRMELAAKGLRQAAQFSWQRTAALTMQSYQRAIRDKRKERCA